MATRNMSPSSWWAAIEGHPFIGEDCTAFVERAFGGRRLFADSPVLRRVGIGVRISDPALPLLRSDAQLDEQARRYLQFDKIKHLPDAVWGYSSASRRSTPISKTALKFFR